MGRKTNAVEETGWKDLPNTHSALSATDVKREYTENGKHVVEAGFDFNTNEISAVKQKIGEMADGEVKQLRASHQWKYQQNIVSGPGFKSCRFRAVECDGLNGDIPSTPTQITNLGTVPIEPETPETPNGEPGPLRTMKNWIKSIASQQTAQWILIGSALVLAAFAVGMGLK